VIITPQLWNLLEKINKLIEEAVPIPDNESAYVTKANLKHLSDAVCRVRDSEGWDPNGEVIGLKRL
jgi:hypothetical protein